MKKFLIFFVLIIILLGMLLSCNQKKEIKLGFSSSLTGIHSSLGISVRDGVQLALEEINGSGGINGRNIRLIIKDDKNDPEAAIKNDKELIEKGVVAIIGHVTSGITSNVIYLLDENDMFMISPTVSSSLLIGESKNFISVHPPSKFEQENIVNKIINNTNIRKVSVLYDLSNKAFSVDWKDFFKHYFTKEGGSVISEIAFNSNDKEFDYLKETQLLLENNPEGILIIASDIDTANFCQQIRKYNKEIAIFSSAWALSNTLLQSGGEAVEGLIISSSWNDNIQSLNYINFKEKFVSRYKREPGFPELYGYETIMVLKEAMLNIKKITPINLKNEIIKIGNFEGVLGEIIINEKGESKRDFYLFEIKNNKLVEVDLN